jgi:hypothetical protein
VKPFTKLVCYALARHFSDAAKPWPVPVTQIMADTGMSNRAVADHIQLAIEAGLLKLERKHNSAGHRSITEYTAAFPDGSPNHLDDEASLSPNEPASSRERGLSENPSPRLSEPTSFSRARLSEPDDILNEPASPSLSERGSRQDFPSEDFPSFPEIEPRAQRRRRKCAMKTILPEDAELDPESDAMRVALEMGLTKAEAIEEFRRFRDYQHAHDKPYANQFAAWRNWLRRSREYRLTPKGRGRSSLADLASAASEELT